MSAPKRTHGTADALERSRDLQLDGAGQDALGELVHELKVHQEELHAQNHQLIETQRALEESRDRYVDLYDFAPIGYMTISPSGIIREINLTGATLLAHDRTSIVGLPFNVFVRPADKLTFTEHLKQSRRIEHGSVLAELTLMTATPTAVQLVTRRHRGNTSEDPVFLTAIIDITARKTLERERREAEDARDKLSRDRELARARADAKDHFLAILSHELRTPLTPIVATMSNNRLLALAPEPLRAALQTARRNLDLEVRLIDDLLDVTRISRDRLMITHERVDLHLIVQEVIDMLTPEIRHRAIVVSTRLEAPEHFVVGDPVRLRQVFWNLLGNAIKFTNSGGVVTISSTAATPGFVEVTVSDTGVGMEREMVDSLNTQDETARSTPVQSSTGLGLGLTICRGVIKAHGGTLHAVSSGKGRGSTFLVQIPVETHPRPETKPAVARETGHDQATRRLRILLVEDHPDSAETLSQLLTYHHYDVEVAGTVSAAVAAAARGFDLLISDIRLPDGSGLDLMRQLRSNMKIRGIAVSGFGTEQDRRRSQEAGYDLHLTKPVDFNRLLDAIETVAPPDAQGRVKV